MKAVEALVIFGGVFFITISSCNCAPQWRPQGRFGKRYTNTRNTDIMTALQSVSDENENLQPLYVESPDVNSDSDVMRDFYNDEPPDVLSLQNRGPLIGGRICIETKVSGVFKCHRGRRSTDSVLTLEEQ